MITKVSTCKSASLLLAAQLSCAGFASGDANSPAQNDHQPGSEQQSPVWVSNGVFARSPDGDYYAYASAPGKVKYCRTLDGVVLRTFYLCAPIALAFSQDGTMLAAAGFSCQQPIIAVWRLTDGQTPFRLETRLTGIQRIEFGADRKSLIGLDRDSQTKLWLLLK